MAYHPSVDALWKRYRANNPNAPEDPPAVFHFCDNEADANACAELVRLGIKRATAPCLPELQLASEPVPQVGDLAVITQWSGHAIAIIRTSAVDIKRFADVDSVFAEREGEGDKSLECWRKAHEEYYKRVLSGTEYQFSDDLMIACESFETVMCA
ncbi:MAG: ASCH domain-containing protein [Pseudomonadota bacterium]